MTAFIRIVRKALFGGILSACISCGSNVPAATTATPPTSTTGVSAESGALVVIGTNTPFLPRGFNSVGVLYPSQYATTLCPFSVGPTSTNGQYLLDAQAAITAQPLSGLSYNASFQAMLQGWYVNTVRFQVSQGALQYEHANGLSAYADMVRRVVAQARAAGLITILSMQSQPLGCTPYQNGVIQKLPDTLTEQAWAQLLNSTLTSDAGVVLEVFNEPATNIACNTGLPWPNVNWTDWATGCGADPKQGMLTVGQYLRTLAPNNVLAFDADASAVSFAGFVVPSGMPSNSVYTVHPYSYVESSESASINVWDSRFGGFEQSGHAVIATEWNEAFSCPKDPNQTITDYFIQTYLPAHSIGVLGHAWDAQVNSSGYLVNSYNYGTNTANYQVVDPNTGGCAVDGGKVLQQEFKTLAGQ